MRSFGRQKETSSSPRNTQRTSQVSSTQLEDGGWSLSPAWWEWRLLRVPEHRISATSNGPSGLPARPGARGGGQKRPPPAPPRASRPAGSSAAPGVKAPTTSRVRSPPGAPGGEGSLRDRNASTFRRARCAPRGLRFRG